MSDSERARDALIERLRTPPTLDRDTPPIEATLRATPEDFVVDEEPAYAPSGEGEHLYLRIEKRGLNTQDAVGQIARALGLDPRGAGWAGLKDRHATTTQWVSLHAKGAPVDVQPGQRFGEQLVVREVSRHGNKLRAGHLRANRFALRLRGVPHARDAELARVLGALEQHGMPNYFGEQRFGHAARNLRDALAWLVDGGRAPRAPFARKLLVSAFQSAIFNHVLAERVVAGELSTARVGDVMQKQPAGGQFVCEDAATDAARVAAWEISPSGPMFGAKMRHAGPPWAEVEAAALAAWGGDEGVLTRMRKFGEGTRRPLRVRPDGLESQREGAELWLRFALPAGAYATVLVRELTKAPLWSDAP